MVADVEDRLIAAGNALVRSLGHGSSCPKRSPAVPCLCAAGSAQAKALSDWCDLIEQINGHLYGV